MTLQYWPILLRKKYARMHILAQLTLNSKDPLNYLNILNHKALYSSFILSCTLFKWTIYPSCFSHFLDQALFTCLCDSFLQLTIFRLSLLQDILRLLTLWFNHGATADVQMALQKGFAHVNINTWLVVLPQIIARIHSNNHAVRELIQSLLVRIGQSHPQVYFLYNLFAVFLGLGMYIRVFFAHQYRRGKRVITEGES